jgi:hypothetical protein
MDKNLFRIGLLALIIASITSCAKNHAEKLSGNGGAVCDTSNISFAGSVTPILQVHCIGCHNSGFPSGGINLDGFENVQPVANNGRLLGAITHSSGFIPMPKDAPKLSSCEIEKIRIWIEKGTQNN